MKTLTQLNFKKSKKLYDRIVKRKTLGQMSEADWKKMQRVTLRMLDAIMEEMP